MVETTLQDLGVAWRKAKVDLYYGSAPSLRMIADYESDLHGNLSKLLEKINGDKEDWVEKEKFLGSWALVPKALDPKLNKAEEGLVFSSPHAQWQHRCSADTKATAEFRLMARCSMDFHVLSTLWILKVGHLLDAQLSKSAFGHRLRRSKDGKSLNLLSLGTFQRYLKPFSQWRDDGIKAMRSALKDGKRVVAITGDVSKFYHQLDPRFMLGSAFLEAVSSRASDEEKERLQEQLERHDRLRGLFIRALQAWAKATPLKNGLPVGLPASHIVANLALIGLDRVIETQVVPLYYGRYVDDIILVMENTNGFNSKEAVWNWLFTHAPDDLGWENEKKESVAFTPPYLAETKTQILFKNEKNKVFILEGDSGQALVEGIAHQIHERASEWRALPVLPKSADDVLRDIVVATQDDGDAADNLRKADSLMLRRAGFAIKLRDYEAYERDLPPEAWQDHRIAFLKAVVEHMLVLPTFFELANFLPRVIRLATACEDFQALRRLLDALEKLCTSLEQDCDLAIAGCKTQPAQATIGERWREHLSTTILEAIIAAFPARLSRDGKRAWDQHMRKWPAELSFQLFPDWPESVSAWQERHARLFFCDLAHTPFRAIGLASEFVPRRGIPAKSKLVTCDPVQAVELLPKDTILNGLVALAKWARLRGGVPMGLLFATRPFNLTELYLLHTDSCREKGRGTLTAIVLATRGFELTEQRPCFDKKDVVQVPVDKPTLDPVIAVSSWKTSDASFAAAVKRMPDPDAGRYARLCGLVNEVIHNPQKSRYFVLPELAIPARWFLRVARKLQGRGISLITGVDYLHTRGGRVRNQIWTALLHDGLGFPSLMVYRQDKQRPALHEEAELFRLGGRKLQPEMPWRNGRPPIIQHGELRFALLLCSELTNIQYRASLRGQIDALFVPEWNQDTETFNALVESAALDIHAYIIQCNVRQYGDSRVRAPSKDSWRRDVLRVKGGEADYCVMGKINAQALRRFQSSHRSPDKPFKPVPDGFKIAWERQVLPSGEME